MDAWKQMQHHHRVAYKELMDGINLESRGLRNQARAAYGRGVQELRRGLAVDEKILSEDRRDQVARLKEKMQCNLDLVLQQMKATAPTEVVRPRCTSSDRMAKPAVCKPDTRLAQRRRTELPQSTQPKCSKNGNGVAKSNNTLNVKNCFKNVDPRLKEVILNQIVQDSSNLRLNDVVGNESAKRALYETVVLPAKNPELFTGLLAPVQGILLFGPPGNGKTMLARAAAGESGHTFLSVSAASLMSKWVGEAEKLVQALFAVARAAQPCIIFIDEIDSILRERSDSEHDLSRRLKTEFLLQFDGVHSNSADRVLVIGATNRPFDLDEAVLRRLPKRINVPLPDKKQRVDMLRVLLQLQKNTMTNSDFNAIADLTNKFSFCDLKTLAKEAAMGPLREIPANQINEIKAGELRAVSFQDFTNALRLCRPSLKTDHLNRLETFNRNHGQ